MSRKYFTKATDIAKKIIEARVKEGNVVIDATVGNGYDTVFLAKLVGETGKVYGFDIQIKAIENTKNKLTDSNLLNRVMLIKDSHENIDNYVNEKVDLVIFNLGYLPGGNHEITTKPDSTIKAIEKSLGILKENGIIVLVIYHGHEMGKLEKNSIEQFVKELNQKQYTVIKFEFINQINNPPLIIAIEKNL
ncbi:SAM-dependent methyltransferase [Caloranaerobacter azorensis H53214]|uniref:SAM-dependent methyltransferase n=1 Tax=Caloranaerobacter azorensis H53214 TaxID=1156417 RepID=A0A096BJJ5_9FIRM|nr:class I SAM-dependent methyltransferase [Caloranaerobacter azorensis]KGG81385.1 SAM-dependent methyltransferase [Caloranaerobacter azorensis H53214]